MDEKEKQIATKILDRILSNEGITKTDQYDGHLQMIYDNLKAIQVQAKVKVNFAEEIEKQMLEKQLAKVEVLSCKGDPDGKYLPTEILLKLGNETKWFSQEQ